VSGGLDSGIWAGTNLMCRGCAGYRWPHIGEWWSSSRPKLLTFNPEDWQSRQQWCDARFQWLLAHPWQTLDGSDVIDVIFQT
jgi:hypothetical protein